MHDKVTIKDIARNTGTSVASVHRALHGTGGVSAELRRKILEDAKRNNYQLDEQASLLRRDPINLTVLLPKAVGNERFYYRGLWQGIYRGIEDLKKMKVNVRCVETKFGVNELSSALEHLYDASYCDKEKIDGLVTICDDEQSRSWIQRFMRRGTKVALVDRGIPFANIVCSVAVSVADMALVAMDLMDLYYDRNEANPILLVNGPIARTSYQAYSRIVKDAANRMGVPIPILEINTEGEERTRNQVAQLLRTQPLGGIIAASARSTYWVCDEVEKAVMPSEEPLPVIGTDVFEEQESFFKSGILRAAICQSHYTFGHRPLQYLFNNLIDPSVAQEVQILEPISIVMRHNFKYFIRTSSM